MNKCDSFKRKLIFSAEDNKNRATILNNIDIVVYQYLVRVLKNKRLYNLLRLNVGKKALNPIYIFSPNTFKKMCDTNKFNKDNPFNNISSLDSVYKILKEQGHFKLNVNSNDEEIQQVVTDKVNFLIHCLIERGIGNIKELEVIGRETFNLVCRKIYGGDFTEITTNKKPSDRFVEKVLSMRNNFLSYEDFIEFVERNTIYNPSNCFEENLDNNVW